MPPERFSVKPVCASAMLAALLMWTVGCNSESSVQPNSIAPDATGASDIEITADESASNDSAALEAAIESVGKTRRDGNGAIIEVDLRESDADGVLEKLPGLPKLRSLLLADATVSSEGLRAVGRITTLENLDLRGATVDDAGVNHLGGLQRLKSIKFSGKDGRTEVTDAAMATLGQLKSLKVIALDFLPITDQGVAALAGLSQLRELYLAGTSVSDSAAETLAKFPELTKLRIASTRFGTAGLENIATLSQLAELDISDCQAIDDAALATLGGLTKLSKLNLYSTSVGDAAWAELTDLKDLRWLNVDKTNITDQSLEALGKLTGLTFLHLGSTQITDAGLQRLAGLSNLETLIVTRTAVTQDGVDQLQQALPKTEIQLEYVEGK